MSERITTSQISGDCAKQSYNIHVNGVVKYAFNDELELANAFHQKMQELSAYQATNAELASRIHEIDAARTERIVELEQELAAARAAAAYITRELCDSHDSAAWLMQKYSWLQDELERAARAAGGDS